MLNLLLLLLCSILLEDAEEDAEGEKDVDDEKEDIQSQEAKKQKAEGQTPPLSEKVYSMH